MIDFFFFFHLNLPEALSGSSYSRLLFKIAGNIQFCDLQPSFEYIYSFFSSNLSVKKINYRNEKDSISRCNNGFKNWNYQRTGKDPSS